MNNKLHFYYHWDQLDGFLFRNAVREFLDNGAERFVISAGLLEQMIRNPERKAGVYLLDKKLDEEVARLHLDKLGAKLTVLSQEQADYIGVQVEGPYKGENYRY